MLNQKDVVRGYVLLVTACDGTLLTVAQFTSIRVVCNNTLRIALGDTPGATRSPTGPVLMLIPSNDSWESPGSANEQIPAPFKRQSCLCRSPHTQRSIAL